MDSLFLLSTASDTSIKVGVWAAQLIIGLGIAMGSIYLAMRLLNKLTKGIDEEAELKRGNVAVAAMTLGVIISVTLVTSSGIVGLTDAVTDVRSGASAATWGRAVGFGVLQLVAGIVFAVISIFMAFRIWDRITVNINEVEELKKGNVAIGIVLAAVLIGVGLVMREGVSGLASAISTIGN